MMKTVLLLFLLFASMVTAAQGNNTAVGKRIDTIHSAILKEDRYIWVHLPKNASTVSSTGFPVVYVLDGDVLFEEVTNIFTRLYKETGKNISDEVIVVGVGNIWLRYRDYSATRISSSPWVDEHTAKTTGGGEAFISFLEKELLPHIHVTYPVSSTRILIGHSMGGLAVMNILLKHTSLFDYYAAIDPSMWWDDQKLLKESKVLLSSKTFEKKSLFLAIANTMNKDMDVAQIKTDNSAKTVLIRPSLTLVDYINASIHSKLRFTWKYYPEHHHMTVSSPGMYDALKYFLKIF